MYKIIATILTCAWCSFAVGDEKVIVVDGREYSKWNLPVFTGITPENPSFEVAQKLADQLRVTAQYSKDNPLIGFWVEIKGKSKVDQPWYIVILNASDATLLASTKTEALAAVARIQQLAIVRDGKIYLPKNVFVVNGLAPINK